MREWRFDLIVVGGGITGLWLHVRALAAGYSSVLLEADRLGCGQTLASQGIIHGGVKYLLGDARSRAAQALKGMPAYWRACLAGKGEVDLRATRVLSEGTCLWSNERLLGEFGTLLASRMMRGRSERLPRQRLPDALRHPAFRGVAYQLDDLVVDPVSLIANLAALANRSRPTTLRWRVRREQLIGGIAGFEGVRTSAGVLRAPLLVLAAGAGNGGLGPRPMQSRPLHQVWLAWPRGIAPPAMYGHCVTGIRHPEPLLTVTTHPHPDGTVWYLGGQLASSGHGRDHDEQVRAALATLGTALPWLNVPQRRVSTLRIDRAEGRNGALRPDDVHVERDGRTITCWPTKLTLAPEVARRVLEMLDAPQAGATAVPPLPLAEVGRAPWQDRAFGFDGPDRAPAPSGEVDEPR